MNTSDRTVGSLSVPTDENLKDSARKNAGTLPRKLFAYIRNIDGTFCRCFGVGAPKAFPSIMDTSSHFKR